MDVNYKEKVIYAEMENGKNRRHNSLFLMHISHPFILAHMLNVLLRKIVRKTEKKCYLSCKVNTVKAEYTCKTTQSRMSDELFNYLYLIPSADVTVSCSMLLPFHLQTKPNQSRIGTLHG